MFLEYGIDPGGELVYIEQAPRGLTDLVCPYCGGRLLARKGKIKVAHFAHAGETCRPAERGGDVISLPVFDRFDLHLSPKDYDALKRWHDHDGYTAKEFYRLRDLKLIEYNEWNRQDELTKLGKILFGELTLAAFSQEQDRLIAQKHTELMSRARATWLGEMDRTIAATDLQLFRAQWRRVLSAFLYFLQIDHPTGTLYKIGVTQRAIMPDRLAEIERDLTPLLGMVKIKVLRRLANRGAIELYFKLRYHAHQHPIGQLTEYFIFDSKTRRNVLSDLTRLGGKELSLTEEAILEGIAPLDLIARGVPTAPEPRRPEAHKIIVTKSPRPPEPAIIDVPQTTRKAHQRLIGLKEYTITCKQCGQTVTLWRYPGRPPTLCSDQCAAEYERERNKANNRERQQRFRERHKRPK